MRPATASGRVVPVKAGGGLESHRVHRPADAVPVSVTAIASSASFEGDSVATDFPLPFRVLDDDDLLVRTTTDDGETYTTLVLDDDYELEGTGPDNGTGTPEAVTLTLTAGALPTGTRLVVERNTDPTQLSTFQPQGEFSPIVFSRMVDKNTLLIQELQRRVAQLESLGELVNVDEIANGARFTTELTVSDPVESNFPIEIGVVNGTAARYIIWRVREEEGSFNDEPPQVDWQNGAEDSIFITFISGLTPGKNYIIDGLVIF